MKISASSLELNSFHSLTRREESSESLQTWVGTPATTQSKPAASTLSSLSATSQTLARQASDQVALDEAVANDPFLSMLVRMVEWMTGKPVKVFSASALDGKFANLPDLPDLSAAPQNQAQSQAQNQAQTQQAVKQALPAGYGIAYDYHRLRSETETTQVAMNGTVRTSDGQEIKLSINLTMNRSFSEETTISLRAGDAKRKDPLVINFSGTAAQLQDQRFSFDLNGDGKNENLPQLSSGSGYLAFDRNGNGRIDNGTELFGPSSNAGFDELAKLDSDGNGWIDEADPAYKQLSVWSPQTSGDAKVTKLNQLDIGALYLGRIASPFELRGNNNSDLGAISASGLFLREDGSAGTMQELDLTV